MSYDRQIVLQMHTGRFDGGVDLLATRLHNKACSASLPSENIMMMLTSKETVMRHLTFKKEAFSRLTDKSRLYVVGHGNWQRKCIANASASSLANILGRDLEMKAVGKIVIGACELGLGSAPDATIVGIDTSSGSFAEEFHRLLAERYQIYTVVHAYVYPLQVVKTTADGRVLKATQDSSGVSYYKTPGSKVVWYFEKGKQQKKYAEYPGEGYSFLATIGADYSEAY